MAEEVMKFEKMPGFATTSGPMYEVMMCGLLYLRGVNSGREFRLATNAEGVGAFDDVVFKVRQDKTQPWDAYFIQLKHKMKKKGKNKNETNNQENGKITRKLLLTKQTGQNSEFSLSKYAGSFKAVKTNISSAKSKYVILNDVVIENCKFILYTNARETKNLNARGKKGAKISNVEEAINCLGKDLSGMLGDVETFVSTNSAMNSGRVFRFDKEVDDDILDVVGKDADGKQFLDLFYLFCGQSTESELASHIQDELAKVTKVAIDKDTAYPIFRDLMKYWWEYSNDILSESSDILVNILSKLEIISKQLNVTFEETSLQPLRLDSHDGKFCVFQIESTEISSRLTCAKLLQANKSTQILFFGIDTFLKNQATISEVCKKVQKKPFVVIFVLDKEDCPQTTVKAMKDIATDTLRVVIVGSKNTHFDSDGLVCKNIKDLFRFAEINKESQDEIFSTKFNFQGCETSLDSCVGPSREKAINDLEALSVLEIIRNGKINKSVGDDLKAKISYYIPRTLGQATILRNSVFQVSSLPASITVKVQSMLDDVIPIFRDRQALLLIQSISEDLRNFSQSHYVVDKRNTLISVTEPFELGSFSCCFVKLRQERPDQVIALRIRPAADNSSKIPKWFLFVDKGASGNDITTLSVFNCSLHFLQLQGDGKLVWLKSERSSPAHILTMDFIRKHIDRKRLPEEHKSERITDFQERLVFVWGEPGMGKSTLMTSLCKVTKDASPNFCVANIALNDHTKLIDTEHKDALKYLLEATRITNPLHKWLLSFSYRVSGNLVVVLDGVDEIAPRYTEKCFTLLTNILKSKTKYIWITSRASVKSKIEDKMSILANKLLKFSRKDQETFLKKYWADKVKISEDELNDFIKKLLDITSRSIRDQDKEFMGIPLQMKMLADVFEGHVTGSDKNTKLPEKMDLLELLDRFVTQKFNIFIEEKCGQDPYNTLFEQIISGLREKFDKDHINAAFVTILNEDEREKLELSAEIEVWLPTFLTEFRKGTEKTGIIEGVFDNKPIFIHRVYAEYFVAKWFAEHISEKRCSEFLAQNLFTDGFGVIRNIFDRILAENLTLHTLVLNEDIDEVEKFLGDVNDVDIGGRTALHLASALGTSNDEERNEIFETLITKSSPDFDLNDEILQGPPLRYADITNSWAVIERLISFPASPADTSYLLTTADNVKNLHYEMLENIAALDLEKLLLFCIEKGFEVDHTSEDFQRLLPKACSHGSLLVVNALIEERAAIGRINDETSSPLHVAAQRGHLAIVEMLYSASKDGNSGEVDYLNLKDSKDFTALHIASFWSHTEVVRYLIQNGANISSLGGKPKHTPFHSAAVKGKPEIIKEFLDTFSDETERAKYVNAGDAAGDTALHHAAMMGNLEIIDILVAAGGDLTRLNHSNRTVLFTSVYNKRSEVAQHILTSFSKILLSLSSPDNDQDKEAGYNRRMKEYVNSVDKLTRSALFYAAWHGLAVIELLIGFGANVQTKDKFGYTPLHAAAITGEVKAMTHLLATVEETKHKFDYVNTFTKFYHSALFFACAAGNLKSVKLLVEAGSNKYYATASSNTNTPLMRAVEYGHVHIVEYLIPPFDIESQCSQMAESIRLEIFLKGHGGRTALHFACQPKLRDNSSVYSSINPGGYCSQPFITPGPSKSKNPKRNCIDVLMSALSKSDKLQYALITDNDGDTALHKASSSGRSDLVSSLLKNGGSCISFNKDQRTPLMLAAKNGHLKVVKMLTKAILSQTDISQADYIAMKYGNGVDAYYLAARYGHEDVFLYLISRWSKSFVPDGSSRSILHAATLNCSSIVVEKILNSVPNDFRAKFANSIDRVGNTALHYAASKGDLPTVIFLINSGANISEVNKKLETPLSLAASCGFLPVAKHLVSTFNNDKKSEAEYINKKDKIGTTALFQAIANNHEEIATFLIEHGAETNWEGALIKKMLHVVAKLNNIAILQSLIKNMTIEERKSFVNHHRGISSGLTPLQAASQSGHFEMVKILVEAGGNLCDNKNERKQTALILAAINNHLNVVDYLIKSFDTVMMCCNQSIGEETKSTSEMSSASIQCKVDYINMQDVKKWTAVQHAVWNGHAKIVELLVESGANVQTRNTDGRTTLHGAIHRKLDTMLCLMNAVTDSTKLGDYINTQDNNGKTALHIAVKRDHAAPFEMLVKAGGKLTLFDNFKKETPLMLAAKRGKHIFVELILLNFSEDREGMSKQEYIGLRNNDGRTALELAMKGSHSRVIKILNELEFFQ